MPEAPDTDIDFLSGDISPINSINDCRYDSRLFATRGMPWDIMSWSTSASIALTSNNPAKHAKTAIQLSREAASVIAQGGAYQIDFQMVPIHEIIVIDE